MRAVEPGETLTALKSFSKKTYPCDCMSQAK